MKLKTILRDETFLSLIWLPFLSCVIGGITIFAFVIMLWALSDSLLSTIQGLKFEVRLTILYSTFGLVLLFVTFLMNWLWLKKYLFLPIVPTKNLIIEIREIRNTDRDDEYLFKDTIWLGMFILVIFIFLVGYIGGESWNNALEASLLFVLPFTIALWFLNFGKFVIELVLLLLRYFIQKDVVPKS